MTEDPNRFAVLKSVYLARNENQTLKPYEMAGFRLHRSQVLIRLKGINDRDKADRLRGLLIFVPFEEAIPLEEGEFFLFQLMGMRVQTDSGRLLGTIQDIIQTGANDVFVVNGEDLGEVLLPDTEEVVLSIDGSERLVTVKLIPGLLPD